MGKFKKRKNYKNKKDIKDAPPKERTGYQVVIPENKDFIEFYKIQNILPAE